jgi:dephospho-CoA kinase
MIIGLSGYAQSGKDTVAEYLVNEYGFTRVAFADPIRKMLYAMNPQVDGTRLVDLVDEYGWDIAKKKPEIRELLQSLGFSARQIIDDRVWIAAAFHYMTDKTANYVIADVRFINEAHMIHSEGGKVWRVIRPGIEAVNTHISETELDRFNFDLILNNDGSVEQLNFLVKQLYEQQSI